MSLLRTRLRRLLARHLFAYLALVVALVGCLTVLLARSDLSSAWSRLDPRYVPVILALTFVNYGLRFFKWHALLRAVKLRIPLASSARIYFACFSMIVTPFRIGELYKLVFLKRLHGAELRRTTPVLVMERATDAIAVLALAALHFDQRFRFPLVMCSLLGLAFAFGVAAGRESPRRVLLSLCAKLPWLGRRIPALAAALEHHGALLRPRMLFLGLSLSMAAWAAECAGLWLLLHALTAPLPLIDASWIYASATALGNLTFLPGGLGSTEATMIGLLSSQGFGREISLPATLLIRVATLWLAVGIGLLVSWQGRRALHWREVAADAAAADTES